MVIIMLGAPGSGKGTQCKWISSKYGIEHISMGDIFRRNIKERTDIGIEAEKYINEGKLVPNSIAIKTLEETLDKIDNLEKGIILDGYPRTIIQAEKLDEYLERKSLKLDAVINLTIPDEEIISRVVNRRICSNVKCGEIYNINNNPSKKENVCDKCGANLIKRADDNQGTALNRVDVYHKQTKPLIKYYNEKGILNTILGVGTLEENQTNIESILNKI